MFFEKPEIDFSSGAVDRPPATLGEIFEASWNAVQRGNGTLGWQNSLEEAYDRRLKQIFDATGQRLDNPMRVYVDPPEGIEAAPMRDPSAHLTFQSRLEDLARQFPDNAAAIGADRPVHMEARALSREAETTETDLFDRTPGVAKYAPYLAANLAAAATDPVNILALVPGFGEVQLGARAVIWAGVKAGVANAGAEALAQPFIQGWRQQAGLDYGLGQAATQIAFAGAFGFMADAGVRGAYRGGKRLLGSDTPAAPSGSLPDPRQAPLDALEAAARAAPEDTPLRRAVEGDDDALAEVAHATGAIDDPAVRGALAELERRKLFGAPPEVDRGEHAARLADAIRQSMDPELPPPGAAVRVRALAEGVEPDPRLAGVKTPLEGARLLRELPDAAGALPLSPHKLKQAIGLSRLSDAAFERVAAGEIPPQFAAVIGNQVEDAGRHAGLVGDMAAAGVKSEKAAKLFVGQSLAGPTSAEAHAIRFGAGQAERELMPERVAVLERALNGLVRDKRIRAVLEREAPGLKGKALLQPLNDLVTRVSELPGRVSELLQEAAAEVAGGAKPVDAAKSFRARLADVLEQDGTRGLLRETSTRAEAELGREGFGDPFGAATKAQTDELKARAAEREAQPDLPPLEAEEINSVLDMWRYVEAMRKVKRPEGLTDWLRRTGGIQEYAGEIRSMLGELNKRPGLVSKKGRTLDDATLAAWQEGFLVSPERPEINDFLSALSDDLAGDTVVREADRALLDELVEAGKFERDLDDLGIRVGQTEDEIRTALGSGSAARESAEGGAGGGKAAQKAAGEETPLERDLAEAKRSKDLGNVTKGCRS